MYEIEMFEIGSVTSGTIFPQEQQMSAMYKVTASDVNASRNCINFVLWAKHTSADASCTDELTLTDSGQLDVLQVHGALSD
jgi:hypothetical protein